MPAESEVTPNATTTNGPVVFFDGVCGLCNYTVNWLLARDPHHRLLFAPLQGKTAAIQIPEELRKRLDTLVLLRGGKLYIRTAAVSRILMTIGGRWWLSGALLWCIPAPFRDLAYRLVSLSRYRLFGRKESCRLPTPEERAVFLD